MTGHAVVVAGGGPTGLMLAGELALAGIDVAVVERRARLELVETRSRGLHSRTIEVLDQRGIADRVLAQGQLAQVAGFGWIRLDISDFPTRHPYGLGLAQQQFEQVLAGWVAELGVPTYFDSEVTGVSQDDSGVDLALAGGSSIRTGYVVGCDGGRSIVRKSSGIEFPGLDPTTSNLLANVRMTGEPELGMGNDGHGVHALSLLEDGQVGVLVTEPEAGRTGNPTLAELREALVATYGTDFGAHSPTWLSRFTDATRQAATYRDRRVLLAGDAAHIHPPVGGQGLQTGVQDAVNLGWKLAQVVKGRSLDSLLDTYHAERHPVGARVNRNTMAQTALLRPDERTAALRETMADLLAMEEPRRHIAAMMSGLDIHYDLGPGHPLLGRRVPDLEVITEHGHRRLFTLLHRAQPFLLNLGEPGAVGAGPWSDRVQVIDARYDGAWELPVIGTVASPAALLVRPDGYVAWVGEGPGAGLPEALATWFGPG